MTFNITIDFRAWLQIAQVGSSIFGDLLKPNDIDIAVAFKLPLVTLKKAFTFRIFKLNIILLSGLTLQEFIDNFDMNIVRGSYKSIFTRKLHQSWASKHAMETKTIQQYERNCELFGNYTGLNSKDVIAERANHYKNKLPTGWTFVGL